MLTVNMKKQLKTFMLEASFSIKDDIVVLFGPSGSGKTTTLHCLSGLSHPDQGQIKLRDRTLFQTNHKPVPVQKRGIGYVFQDYALFPHMTVRKNILYGAKTTDDVDQLVRSLGIGHLLEEYPQNISGGEKQRVALARAFATEPDLLLLDEPFSSLDENVKEECHRELVRLHEKWQIPVILVTHDRVEAEKLADQVIEIDKGRVIG